MSGAQSISTRRAYGVQRVCRVWHRARSSVYARRQATRSPARCRRRGPIGAAPDDVLVAHIRRVLEASPFHGEGYRKAWAKLRVAGMRTSKERVRRLMRESGLQAPPRAGHAHGPKALGRRRWKKASGYHQHARVENAFFRYKSIVGDCLRARSSSGQRREAVLACHVLNRMTELGRPVSYRIGR